MYTVRIEDGFSAAHFLTRYHGKCERLHGHNYKVFVTASGRELDDGGMLLDFGILKGTLRKITLELDHTSLNDHPAFSDGCPSAETDRAFHLRADARRDAEGEPDAGRGLRDRQEQGDLLSRLRS